MPGWRAETVAVTVFPDTDTGADCPSTEIWAVLELIPESGSVQVTDNVLKDARSWNADGLLDD